MAVSRPARIRLTVHVPSDKSISHRCLILNALADGAARIDGILESEDVRSTARCLGDLGVGIDWPAGSASATVRGRGLHGLAEPEDVLDCGNSGTSIRLLAGVLAAQPFLSILSGDSSLRGRPMARVIGPLREMGAGIQARRGDTLPPLVIRGGPLRGIAYDTPVASAQVKSALLLAGRLAAGPTSVREPAQSRDHTERMLGAMGAQISLDGGRIVVIPAERLEPLDVRVPGDISSAAPWLVLGACHPDAEITVCGVNTNPTRTGLVDIMTAMGADLEVQEQRMVGGEPVADIVVRTSRLRGVEVSGALVPRAIDELPLVAVLGCFAEGRTAVRDAAELRAKESDRVESVVSVLGRMGAAVEPAPDGFAVVPGALHGAWVDAGGDHRIGMLAAIAGAVADGETWVDNDAVSVSYPGFWADLATAGAGTPV